MARTVLVSGWCARGSCRQPFTYPMPWTPGQIASTWTTFCSQRCRSAVVKARKKARRRERLCWGCWSSPQRYGLLCAPCWYAAERTAQAMCDGKQRVDEVTAVGWARSWVDERMNAYLCRVCGHWHVGHAPADPVEMKRRVLLVGLLLDSYPVAEVEAMVRAWAPA